MRRFSSASSVAFAAILFFTAVWSACGGGSSSSASAIAQFVFAPTVISLEPGQTVTVTATAYNSAGTVVSATVTYTTSDANNADITQGGVLCAGHWDDTQTVCTPGNPAQLGQFTISATANSATGTATAYIHQHVDSVVLTAPSAACTSSGQTVGVTAQAFTYEGGSCSQAAPCDISNQVGAFNFGVLDSTVASFPNANVGTLKAGIPGTTKIYASVPTGGSSASTTSTALPYTTCLVDSISLHVQSKTDTSFTVANAASATLQADVLDTAGTTITPTLTYNNLQAAVGTLSGSTGTATYAGEAPGYGSMVASCTPPSCNKNVSAVFSNVVTSTVETTTSPATVTANETNVYVTGAGAVQLYPVDTTLFTLGTVISLPYAPNSIAMSRDGSHIYLGGNTAAMVVSTASNSVQVLSFPGQVLAVAPNNAYVIFASTAATNNVYIMSGSSLTIANAGGFSVPGVKSASFTPDGNTVYFATNTGLYRYRIIGDSGSTPAPLTLTPSGNPLGGATANDVKTSANGTIVFTGTSANIVAAETCNANVNNQYVTAFDSLPGVASPATTLAPLPNGSGVLALNGTNLDNVTITTPNPLTSPFAGCPATNFAVTPSTISLSALGSGFTVNQLIVSNSGHYAAILTGCSSGCTPQVGIVDLTKGTLSAVSLVDKGSSPLTQIYSGSFMIDDSGLWVGADDAYIHFVNVTTLADTEQVSVPVQGPSTGSTPNYVNPTLVVVQPK
jgi:sugar lactone lactonase YvrE